MVTLDQPAKRKNADRKAPAALVDIDDLYIAARAAYRDGRQDVVSEFLARMEKYCHETIRRAMRRSGKTRSEVCSNVNEMLMVLLAADEPLPTRETCAVGTRIFTLVKNMLMQDQDMEARHYSVHVYGDEAVKTAITGETNAEKHRKETNHYRIRAHLERLGRDYMDWYAERCEGRSPEDLVSKGGITTSTATIYERRMIDAVELFGAPQQPCGTQPRKIRSNDH